MSFYRAGPILIGDYKFSRFLPTCPSDLDLYRDMGNSQTQMEPFVELTEAMDLPQLEETPPPADERLILESPMDLNKKDETDLVCYETLIKQKEEIKSPNVERPRIMMSQPDNIRTIYCKYCGNFYGPKNINNHHCWERPPWKY